MLVNVLKRVFWDESSTDRRIKVTVTLGNGMEINIESAYQLDTHNATDLELVFLGATGRDSDLEC